MNNKKIKFIPMLFSTAMVEVLLTGQKTQTRRTEDRNIEVGDVIWSRETFQHTKILGLNPEDENYGYVYKASENGKFFSENVDNWKWKPSLFMPKEACRLFFRVRNVRTESLHQITDLDAIAEGCVLYDPFDEYRGGLKKGKNKSSMQYNAFRKPKDAFKNLWETINGKESWDSNPIVFVYDLEKIERPEDFPIS